MDIPFRFIYNVSDILYRLLIMAECQKIKV